MIHTRLILELLKFCEGKNIRETIIENAPDIKEKWDLKEYELYEVIKRLENERGRFVTPAVAHKELDTPDIIVPEIILPEGEMISEQSVPESVIGEGEVLDEKQTPEPKEVRHERERRIPHVVKKETPRAVKKEVIQPKKKKK